MKRVIRFGIGTLAACAAVIASSSGSGFLATAEPTPSVAGPVSDIEAAIADAQHQGTRVEVTSLQDEFSTTYANPDATLTTEASVSPLRVQRAGGWADVDYDLEHVNGGWSPKVSLVPVVFSDGADADAASLGSGQQEVGLSWDVTLPVPSIDGPTATYDLGGGQSLVLTATPTGFEQSLVLERPPTSLPRIKLPFDTSGLNLIANDSGGYDFVDPSGAALYTVPTPVMHGSATDPETGDWAEKRAVATALVQTDDAARLDLSPSMTWLQDPATTYPVTIDPQVVALSSVKDTYVQDNTTVAENASWWMHVGMFNGHDSRAYLRFDMPDSVLGAEVVAASLKLRNFTANNCTSGTVRARPIMDDWNATLTWSDPQPAINLADQYLGQATFAHGGGSNCPIAFDSVDVTNMVQGWADGSLENHGLRLAGADASPTGQGWGFCSKDYDPTAPTCTQASVIPTLTITYDSTVVRGTVAEGSPVVGAQVTLLAWPNSDTIAGGTEDSEIDPIELATTTTSSVGSYSLAANLGSLPNGYVESDGSIALEVDTSVDGMGQSHVFTGAKLATPAAQGARVSAVPGAPDSLDFDMSSQTVADGAMASLETSDEDGHADVSAAPVHAIEPKSDGMQAMVELPSYPNCDAWRLGEMLLARPEHFVDVFTWSGAPAEVTETSSSSHSLGVAIDVGGGWGADGSIDKETHQSTTANDVVTTATAISNTVNYRKLYQKCIVWEDPPYHTLYHFTYHHALWPIGFSNLVVQSLNRPATMPEFTGGCTLVYPRAGWDITRTKSSGSNVKYTGGVDLGIAHVSSHASFSSDTEIVWHIRQKGVFCGSNSSGPASAPQASVRAFHTNGVGSCSVPPEGIDYGDTAGSVIPC